jgi:hypothetical protein
MMTKILPISMLVLALVGCSDSDTAMPMNDEIPSVSNDAELQLAYESCVKDTRKELRADNPDTPADIMKHLYAGANQTCHSAVIITCEKNKQSGACKIILNMYQ